MAESALRADSPLYPTLVKSSLIILISCGKGHKGGPSDKNLPFMWMGRYDWSTYDAVSDLMHIAQLNCTETRFQKCSQSGKNGFKHPILSISMAYNVISCKKVERNTQKLKIADFTM